MATSPHVRIPPVSWDVISVILAAIGLVMFLVPVLGIPVSCAGAVAGAIGLYTSRTGATGVRMSFAGLVIGVFAATIELTIMFGPINYLEEETVVPAVRPVPARPYVPPPAPARVEDGTIPVFVVGGLSEADTGIHRCAISASETPPAGIVERPSAGRQGILTLALSQKERGHGIGVRDASHTD
jgi:hypothetical protein